MPLSDASQNEVGVIGLDVTGRNVALRLAELNFKVAACDWEGVKRLALREMTTDRRLRVAPSLSDLTAGLRQPRAILLFGSPHAPVCVVLERLLPDLQIGDLVMDAGPSYFKDTAKHKRRLAERGVQFMGLGLSSGEKAARQGGMVLAGGGPEVRRQARPLLAALAASVRGESCISFFETAAAAHFVKMVHVVIEYALLQLLSETFDLLQRTLLLTDEEVHEAAGARLLGVLNGYLMEIFGQIFDPMDRHAAQKLLREKLASAQSDTMGKWVAQCAGELEVPIPTLEAAVEIHRIGATERRQALAAATCRHPVRRSADDRERVMDELLGAFQAAMIVTYAQALALLNAASQQLGFRFNLHEITRAWRGCAHLRTSLLDDITTALETTPDLPCLLADDDLSERVMSCQENLRHAVWRTHELDIVAPALLASLDYLDSNRGAWMPVNMIQVAHRQPRVASPAYSYSFS